MSERLNCVGYVYHQFGIEKQEKYVHPPMLEELLQNFKIVEKLELADAVAIAVMDGVRDPVVIHMAKIEENKWRITHRRGVGEPIVGENIKYGLKNFLNVKYAELVFLAFRK